jgi:hypothetical protein
MPPSHQRLLTGMVVLTATFIAVLSARPWAESFNDGSRLAVVESLVDYHTLAIDRSIFVDTPRLDSPRRQLPYPPELDQLSIDGTMDRVRVNGHFYSDKPPTQSLLMAGVYQVLQWTFGLRARDRADLFCYLMTLTSSGLAYVVAVVCTYRLGRTLGLSDGWSVALCGSLGLATVALPYSRHVNSHIVLLAAAVPLFERLSAFARAGKPPGAGSLLLVGTLAGFGYALEQGGGLLLLGGVLLLLTWRWRLRAVLLAGLGALPWVVLHHGLTYAVAGTLAPINSIPEYFDYPGSRFNAANMTGRWHHAGLWDFASYAGMLLFSDRGFLEANLPLLLAVPAVPFLLWREKGMRLEILFAVGWTVGTWLIYAALSNNYAGVCCSVRWFVPLLAPGFFLLGLLLRDWPGWRADFLDLSGWGAVQSALFWYGGGTWCSQIPGFWVLQGAALMTWLATTTCLPLPLDRVPRAVWTWAGLGLTALLALPPLFESLPVRLVPEFGDDWAALGQTLVSWGLLLAVAVRARADRREGEAASWITVGLALLAVALTVIHWLLVDRDPTKARWQQRTYLEILNHTAGAPHNFRPLPYGFTRLLELLTGDWTFSCLAYRWFFTFWLLWAAYRLARRAPGGSHPPGRALLTLVPLVLLYPLSVAHYYGQLTDPLSHALFVLALVYLMEDRVWPLAAALALGVMAKETAVLLVPVYLACHWRRGWRTWAATAGLGAVCGAAFLAVRLPLGWLTVKDNINGVEGLMIGPNLGFDTRTAWTTAPLWENYLHPLLFVGPFVPFLVLWWRRLDVRLRTAAVVLTPLLLASNLCFGWLYESRNYMPLVPLLATLAMPPCKENNNEASGAASARRYSPSPAG